MAGLPSNTKYKALLSPLKIGPIVLRNRIVFPACETNYGTRDGFVTNHTVDYYTERAKNGAGLIIIEGTSVKKGGEISLCALSVYDDRYIKGLKALASSVKAHGAGVLLQLIHAGARDLTDITGAESVAPSNVPVRHQEPPRALTAEEVHDMAVAFGEGARRAREAGFDGVEINAAHLWLVSQFLSPYTNKRTDRYGGSLEGRARFLLEIIREIRARVGRDFLISCRINAVEKVPEGITLEESKRTAQLLEEVGSDILSVSAVDRIEKSQKHFNMVYSILPKSAPQGAITGYAAELKNVVDIPVIAVGKILGPEVAEQVLQEGKADLVAMARAIIADPELPRKVMEDRVQDIKACTECPACNITVGHLQIPMRCAVNPALKRKYSSGAQAIQ